MYKGCGASFSYVSLSSAATNNCGGRILGTIRDVYIVYEKAGDHYARRILAVLPVLS